MKLSTKGQYSMYAMVYLAAHAGEGPQTLREIQGFGVTEDYLEQLLGALRRGGLVETVRGTNGGYMLSRKPDEITVGDIIRTAEGPVTLAQCVGDEKRCPSAALCPTLPVWQYLTEQIDMVLDTVTLRDILDERKFQRPERKMN